MIWTILDRVVNLTFLLLAIIIITILLQARGDDAHSNNAFDAVKALDIKLAKVIATNLEYAEVRINRLARNADEYQTSTSVRLDSLEGKVRAIEAVNKALKSQQKIINTNNNLVNVQKQCVPHENKNNSLQ